MTASDREFDALIARRVFGQTVDQLCAPMEGGNGTFGFFRMVRPNADAPDSERTPLPRYSTDIAAAWLIVEHLRSAGFAPLLMFSPADVETDVPCHASLIRSYEEPMDSEIEIDAETMPLAICRVALMVARRGG